MYAYADPTFIVFVSDSPYRCWSLITIVLTPRSARRAPAQQEAHSNGTGSKLSDHGGQSCDIEGSAGISRCLQITQMYADHYPH
jgi:hypothetical protein